MEARFGGGTAVRSTLAAFGVAIAALTLSVSTVTAAGGWGQRIVVDRSAQCDQASLAIDGDGRSHVAAICNDSVRYSEETPNGWITSSLATGGFDHNAQVTIDGSTLYLAYSHEPLLGCGDTPDVAGVYIRSRSLPDGAWSSAKRIGHVRDQLVSFRVVNGKFHATIYDVDAVPMYETNASGVTKRYPLPGGVGDSSLRVGSDGRARIVYEATNSLRYAVFMSGALRWSNIPGTSNRDASPVLVLDAHNAAHVVWEHDQRSSNFGCVIPDFNTTRKGTYYATNASGQWTPASQRRFTANLGIPSLTLDTATGRVHVVVGNQTSLKYYTKSNSGSWSGVTISTLPATSTAIRLDQTRHRLVAIFADGRVYALSKP